MHSQQFPALTCRESHEHESVSHGDGENVRDGSGHVDDNRANAIVEQKPVDDPDDAHGSCDGHQAYEEKLMLVTKRYNNLFMMEPHIT